MKAKNTFANENRDRQMQSGSADLWSQDFGV